MSRAAILARSPARNLTLIDYAPAGTSLLAEVHEGLARSQKSLPPKLFYDARGAQLFQRICTTPAYYPTRTETGILLGNGPQIASALGPDVMVVEPGAGEMQKIRLLLPRVRPRAYVAVDISIEQLQQEAERLAHDFRWLDVTAIGADFADPRLEAALDDDCGRRCLFFPGSTIGNLDPSDARTFLERAARLVRAGGSALVGVDLLKGRAILNRAYNDPQGYTAQFNLNLLERLNREMDADFDLEAFAHRAFFNEGLRRVEMHLVSLRHQDVRVGGKTFTFLPGETIHTENSYKYDAEQFGALAREAGFARSQVWTDANRYFGVFLLSNG